jgi:hypothetical protein
LSAPVSIIRMKSNRTVAAIVISISKKHDYFHQIRFTRFDVSYQFLLTTVPIY